MSSVEKLFHHLKKTKGKPHEILKNCALTNDGFEMAWTNLIERYEIPRILVHSQLKTLFNLLNNPIVKESGPSIKQLQLLNINTSNWDVIFVFICSKCLPNISLHLWQQHLGNRKELPIWKDMDSFLACRYQSLEDYADIRSNPPESQNVQKKLPLKRIIRITLRKLKFFKQRSLVARTENVYFVKILTP